MIKDIHASGRYMQVQGGSSSTYINGYSGLQGVGNMRYNTTNQTMEVFDGNNWIQLNMGYASVGLNGDAEALLDWARMERDKQLARKAKVRSNPALQKAYEAIQRAEENFDMIETLVGDYQAEENEGPTSCQ